MGCALDWASERVLDSLFVVRQRVLLVGVFPPKNIEYKDSILLLVDLENEPAVSNGELDSPDALVTAQFDGLGIRKRTGLQCTAGSVDFGLCLLRETHSLKTRHIGERHYPVVRHTLDYCFKSMRPMTPIAGG